MPHKRATKAPTASRATFHVVYISRTSVQSVFGEPLKQSAHPIRYTTKTYRRSLLVFLSREVGVRLWHFSLIHYIATNPLIPGEELSHLSELSFIMPPASIWADFFLSKCRFLTETPSKSNNYRRLIRPSCRTNHDESSLE